MVGSPEAGTGKGQRLRVYEPRVGGRMEMEVSLDGEPARYGGPIIAFESERELTFDNDWIPNRGWARPTRITIRLTAAGAGTVVEVLHYGFESAAADAGKEHAGYEGGWGMTQLNALRRAIGATAGAEGIEPGALVVRRSIEIKASPERVWREFETFEQFSAWWSVDTLALKATVVRWEPAPAGGWDAPMHVILRLTPTARGTLVEILHHGWEGLGAHAADVHAGFEAGWSLAELSQLKQVVEAA